MLRRLINRILIGALNSIGSEGKAQLFALLSKSHHEIKYGRFRKKYRLAESFRFNGQNIQMSGDGEIICGDDSYIGSNSAINSGRGLRVVIGRKCHISHNVRIYTRANVADQPFNSSEKKVNTGDVVIEDFVWVGANVVVMPGVTIGINSVVGANSVVSKNVPANSIWAGAPIKQIREKSHKI